MVHPIDLATALLVIFVRRFLRRLPFVQASILASSTPQVSLYRPISFIAGGFLYFITKNKHQEWLQIAREFSRRRLTRHPNINFGHSEHIHHRVADRIEKAKAWSSDSFQGPQELQKKSKMYLQNYCKTKKIPLILENHTVSRFVPIPKSRVSKHGDAHNSHNANTHEVKAVPMQCSSVPTVILDDTEPSTSTNISHARAPLMHAKRKKSLDTADPSNSFNKFQIRETPSKSPSRGGAVLKRRHSLNHDSLTEVKHERHRRKRVNNGKITKTGISLRTNSETILLDLENNTDKFPTFTPPNNDDNGGVGDALRDLELIRTTRSGKIYGYREIIKKRRNRFRH